MCIPINLLPLSLFNLLQSVELLCQISLWHRLPLLSQFSLFPQIVFHTLSFIHLILEPGLVPHALEGCLF
jgi:hypothetical protein